MKDRTITQEQCERAVEALQESGFQASHVMYAPDDHGVYLDGVWDDDLRESNSFRIHDEEIRWWAPESKTQTT